MKYVDTIRNMLPATLRIKLKEQTILSYFIAPFYGYLMLPKFDGTAMIYGEKNNFLVHPDISAIDCLREIYRQNVYEKFKNIKPGDIVIDIGANVGIFSVKAAIESGDGGLVFSYEPSPKNFRILRSNIKIHDTTNVIQNQKALGDKLGKLMMIVTSIAGQNRGLKNENVEKNEVVETELTTLDEEIKILKIQRVDFMKIDVEGMELDVLKGGEKPLNL